jgi:hypothetical protein
VGVSTIANSLPLLKSLSLSWCKSFTDEGVKTLANLRHLAHLDLSLCTTLTDASCHLLGNLPSLTDLDVSGCSGFSPDGMQLLVRKPGPPPRGDVTPTSTSVPAVPAAPPPAEAAPTNRPLFRSDSLPSRAPRARSDSFSLLGTGASRLLDRPCLLRTLVLSHTRASLPTLLHAANHAPSLRLLDLSHCPGIALDGPAAREAVGRLVGRSCEVRWAVDDVVSRPREPSFSPGL